MSRTLRASLVAVAALTLAMVPAQVRAAVISQTKSTAGTVVDGPVGTWNTPANAASINGSCTLGNGTSSNSMTITNWGFAIPAGATILGITVRSVSSFNDVSTQDSISLAKASVAVGSSKVLNGPGTNAVPGCGSPIGGASGLTVGATNDLWGATWTLAEINAAGFGVIYGASFSNTAIDGVEITVTYDDGLSPPLTVAINQAAAQLDPTNASPINFTVIFSQAVANFVTGDVSFAGSTTGGSLVGTVTGGPTQYNVAVTGMAASGVVTASINAGVATDGASTPNGASTSTDNTVTYDIVAPTVIINQAGAQVDPTNVSPINFTVTFSEPMTGFATGDVSFTGSTVGGSLTGTVTGGPMIFNVAVTGMTGVGTVVASINASVATDAAGNGNAASTSTDHTVTYDSVGPTVTVNQAVAQDDPTVLTPINFTAIFNEPPVGFGNGAVSLAGSTVGGVLSVNVTGGPTTFNIAVTGMNGVGTVIASINAAAVTDALGNAGSASTSTDNVVTNLFSVPAMPIVAMMLLAMGTLWLATRRVRRTRNRIAS